jgi:hypothetical protein
VQCRKALTNFISSDLQYTKIENGISYGMEWDWLRRGAWGGGGGMTVSCADEFQVSLADQTLIYLGFFGKGSDTNHCKKKWSPY